jgi:hypothetical protein
LFCSVLLRNKTQNRIGSEPTEIGDYFSSWKVKISSEITETILFTKLPKMTKLKEIHKNYFNGPLEWKNGVMHLGVALSTKFTETNIQSSHRQMQKKSGNHHEIPFPFTEMNRFFDRSGE